MRPTLLLIALSLSALPAAAQEPTVELTTTEEFATAHAVNESIDAMSDAVMTSLEAGEGTAAECLCRNRHLVEALGAAYRAAMQLYPEWHDRIVFYTRPADPLSYNIALDGVRRQIETVDCPEQ